ncbi:MAG: ankyrin repeat domain-containing protein [Pyrinomonadaceae bacterium]
MNKNLLDLIKVPEPCDKSWVEMVGNEQTRLCVSCERNVYNLAEMSADEIEKLILRSKGRVCVRLTYNEKEKIQIKNNRLTKIAASVISAALSLAVMANAQSEVENSFPQPSKKQSQSLKNTSQISFTIYDENGAVIPKAQVKLINDKSKKEFIVSADEKGIAYFYNLPRRRYIVEVTMPYFIKESLSVILKEKIEPNINITLGVGAFVGVVSINWYETPIFNSIVQKDFNVVKNYIAQRKDVNIVNKATGKTMLHLATQSENFDLVQLLIQAGAKINAKDSVGRTPLLTIGEDEENKEDDLKILKLLIKRGTDVNVRDKDENGRTLLMMVCEEDNLEIVKILLEAGANPNIKDEDGETAMTKTESKEIKELLKKYGAK